MFSGGIVGIFCRESPRSYIAVMARRCLKQALHPNVPVRVHTLFRIYVLCRIVLNPLKNRIPEFLVKCIRKLSPSSGTRARNSLVAAVVKSFFLTGRFLQGCFFDRTIAMIVNPFPVGIVFVL